MVVLSRTSGKEQESQKDIEEEEDKILAEALRADRRAAEAAKKEDAEADGLAESVADKDSAGGSTLKSENSAGAVNAIEEASRKMRLIALKAY